MLLKIIPHLTTLVNKITTITLCYNHLMDNNYHLSWCWNNNTIRSKTTFSSITGNYSVTMKAFPLFTNNTNATQLVTMRHGTNETESHTNKRKQTAAVCSQWPSLTNTNKVCIYITSALYVYSNVPLIEVVLLVRGGSNRVDY